ncbi:MAG: hypothetical protein WC783_00790 [Candidatus Paceibacterota bacterium]|jgi:hypothetical protein
MHLKEIPNPVNFNLHTISTVIPESLQDTEFCYLIPQLSFISDKYKNSLKILYLPPKFEKYTKYFEIGLWDKIEDIKDFKKWTDDVINFDNKISANVPVAFLTPEYIQYYPKWGQELKIWLNRYINNKEDISKLNDIVKKAELTYNFTTNLKKYEINIYDFKGVYIAKDSLENKLRSICISDLFIGTWSIEACLALILNKQLLLEGKVPDYIDEKAKKNILSIKRLNETTLKMKEMFY